METILIIALLVYFTSVACNGEGLDEIIRVAINDQNYTCNAGDSSTPSPESEFCDRSPCFAIGTNKSLILKQENPRATAAALWCDFIQDLEFVGCVLEAFSGPCAETDPEDPENVNLLFAQIGFFQENCMCIDSAELNPTCKTEDPCEKARPCLNGWCVSKPTKPSGRSYTSRRYRPGYGYKPDLTEYQFVGCICPAGFSGDFCQNCDTCKQCRKFDECDCAAGYGGPTCTLTCESIIQSKRELYQSCLQVTMDAYYALSFPSFCFLNMEMAQCIAASAQNCGLDPADPKFLVDEPWFEYWVTIVVDIVELLIVNGKCIIFGDIPKIR